jgi:hypothetical protein
MIPVRNQPAAPCGNRQKFQINVSIFELSAGRLSRFAGKFVRQGHGMYWFVFPSRPGLKKLTPFHSLGIFNTG